MFTSGERLSLIPGVAVMRKSYDLYGYIAEAPILARNMQSISP